MAQGVEAVFPGRLPRSSGLFFLSRLKGARREGVVQVRSRASDRLRMLGCVCLGTATATAVAVAVRA
ncbi:hypothetical protein F610DRAFT_03802 [Streptomyces sp. LaPpAH-199]|nr:hypothetical protein F610DRAFT_03802 [Streptomyces sp. LaPpAH-199]